MLGTFLHTLHVPKTGLIMVSLSVVLLIAQRRVYPARGSTIATAVVAAAIKSLSPGGIILGPIFGILSEALVVELVLLLSPRSFVLSVLAGASAVFWSQVQSVFKKWIYYGNDIWEIFVTLVKKVFGEQAAGWGVIWAVVALVSLVLIIGGSAGLWGYFTGNRVRRELDKRLASSELEEHEAIAAARNAAEAGDAELEFAASSRGRSIDERVIRTRLYVAPFILLAFILQFTGNIIFSAVSLLIILVAIGFASKKLLFSLWWPRFWLATLLVSAIGGCILAWRFGNGDIWDFRYGIEASIRMIVRGAFVFSLVSWCTRCILPEEILKFWSKIGLQPMGRAMTSSYQLLPLWLDKINVMLKDAPTGFFKKFRYMRHCVVLCLVEASVQAQQLANE
ncbi:MAG: hypothetical protein ACOX8U_01555 [Bradymonadia bacterium]